MPLMEAEVEKHCFKRPKKERLFTAGIFGVFKSTFVPKTNMNKMDT